MRFPMAVTLALSLVACASSRSSQANKDSGTKETLQSNAGGPNAKGKYTCTYEEDTGSHHRTKICRYVEDTAEARERTQQDIRDLSQHQTTDHH